MSDWKAQWQNFVDLGKFPDLGFTINGHHFQAGTNTFLAFLKDATRNEAQEALKVCSKFSTEELNLASQHGGTRRPSSTDSFTAEIARKNAIKKNNIKIVRAAVMHRNNKYKQPVVKKRNMTLLTGNGSSVSRTPTEVRPGSTATHRFRGATKAEDVYDPFDVTEMREWGASWERAKENRMDLG